MKNLALNVILWLCLTTQLGYTQATHSGLTYDKERNQLVLDQWPISSWLDTVLDANNPDVSYHFLPPSLYSETPTRGWRISDDKPDFSSFFQGSSYTPSKEQLQFGWFYSLGQPSSIPNGWIYSPTFSLFANRTGLEGLDRFFRYYSGSIPVLIPSVLNKVKTGQFIRLLIPPDDNLAYVDLDFPHSLVLAYRNILPIGSGMMLCVLYVLKNTPPSPPTKNPEIIKGTVVHKDGKRFPFLYKVEISESVDPSKPTPQ